MTNKGLEHREVQKQDEPKQTDRPEKIPGHGGVGFAHAWGLWQRVQLLKYQ